MQIAWNLATPSPPFSSVNNLKHPTLLYRKLTIGGLRSSSSSSSSLKLKASANAAETPAIFETVDYSSTFSVFPAEACETIGGDACLADMWPEVKLQSPDTTRPKSELIDTDYLQYDDPKTVLLGEACDVLGGEFCDRPYQIGINNN